MQKANVKLFCLNFWTNVVALKSFYALYGVFLLLTVYCAVSSISNYNTQNNLRAAHQAKARASWEANPDKHPHRMAHFGTFAFRNSPPLSIFDYGIENYTGSTVFLEAHRQNSVTFSEATFSTGTLRFGELSLAFLLQTILPLILFFIGFSTVAKDRENGTLKVLLTQGAQWKEIIFGKTLGLFLVALLFFIPVLLVVVFGLVVFVEGQIGDEQWLRLVILCVFYLVFFFTVATLTVCVSARSKQAKNALLRLLVLWLFFVVFLPKSSQALGDYWFPTPTKLAFNVAIEKEVIEKGDSHNPNDPYYNQLRDSVFAVHQVDKVTDLPFNYSGFIMREGEKISSQLYRKNYQKLVSIYQNQNNVTRYSSLVNPFTALKQLSMILVGTDFMAYHDFQEQADDYRFSLAQTMNELQMEFISPKKESGSEGKTHVIGHEHWEEFADFVHQTTPFSKSLTAAGFALFALLGWLLAGFGFINVTAKKASAL